jgi:hypothetical protein
MNREKNLMKYGFASILLLASFLMTVPANQYQSIFAQTGEEASEDNQQNVTEIEAEENTTDVEIPEFENKTAAFTPPPEGDREAPPIPANAIKGADIPKEQPPKDTDSQPLSVSNRTELLEILPANSTKIIEHVDEDLKNSTGEGLLPPAILDKIISGDQGNNNTILDVSTPEELDEIKNFSDSTINQTSEEAVEEGEVVSNITNATGLGNLLDENLSNATNATSAETPSGDQQESEDGEQQGQAGEAVNMTNATSAGATGSEDDEQQQDQDQDQEDTEDGEQQGQAGEAVNMTNATSGELMNATSATGQTGSEDDEQQQDQDQEDTEDGEQQGQAGAAGATGSEDDEQQQDQDQEDTEDQEEEAATSVTNATPGILNATNATSMLNATGLEDSNEDSEDDPEDE